MTKINKKLFFKKKSSMSAPRRTKRHPPPPPTPKNLQLPRRIRLHRPPVPNSALSEPRRNLRSLFVEEQNINGSDRPFVAEEKWKVEAEMLRAECDFLRTERDATFQRLDKAQERKKIDGSDIIEKKMGKLQVRSRGAAKEEEGHSVREIRETETSSLSSSNIAKHKQEINVEMLKRKMEGLSKGIVKRIDEYGSFFIYSSNNNNNNNNNNNSIATASSGYSGQNQWRTGCRQEVAEVGSQNQVKETGAMKGRCCCNCKQIVRRIAEEVKAESEQWTEMQDMLDQVRVEMEDLKSSRDLWQRRAIASELNLHALYTHMMEWKPKARASEQTATELQKHALQLEKPSRAVSPSQDDFSDDWKPRRLPRIKCQQVQQRSPDCSAMEKEKHVLVCRLNSTRSKFPRRCPLQEIGNSKDLRHPSLSNLKSSKHQEY